MHDAEKAKKLGYASTGDPAERVKSALLLHTSKPIGLKWYCLEECAALAGALDLLPEDDRAKVDLVFVRRPRKRR